MAVIPSSFEGLNINHSPFQTEITNLLRKRGYSVNKIDYPDLLVGVKKEIQYDNKNILGLYVRSLPDIIVTDPNQSDYSFLLDIKTSFSKHGAFIEAFPWACNIERSVLYNGLKTIYMYKYSTTEETIRKAFFADGRNIYHS